MNLLPKSHEEFSQKQYWDSFFKKRGVNAFEWYGEYVELSKNLHKYIKINDEILITGCGNSRLGHDLYDLGYNNITNIDISEVVINQMLNQNKKKRPNLKFLKMDVFQMDFQDNNFNVVLDKGTLDALMSNDKPETLREINKYFNEIQRIVKFGGRFICISLLQIHILKTLLEYFPQNNWMFRVVRCLEAEVNSYEKELPVFMVICTKFKVLPEIILEINFGNDDKMHRLKNIDDIIKQINNIQETSFICSKLTNISTTDGKEVFLELLRAEDQVPRYNIYIVNYPYMKFNLQYAVFIVPQGRETEWLFSTEKGRKHLIKTTECARLVIVTLIRNQQYGTFEEVQIELQEVVQNLTPKNYRNKKIPFLSLGSDIGQRIVRYEGNSLYSGKYFVEDVEIDNEIFRRLHFNNSQFVIQSEAKLKSIKLRKGLKKDIIDATYLTSKYHVFMCIGTHLIINQNNPKKIAIIGLGGGGLCTFLRKFITKLNILAIEIDEDIYKVAINWFNLIEDNYLNVKIMDGLKFIDECVEKNEKFDAILFDVDSKDNSIGMSCPPKQFLDNLVLEKVLKIIGDTGFFILNTVIRDKQLKPEILKNLNVIFKTIVGFKIKDNLNEVLICTLKKQQKQKLEQNILNSAKEINKFFKKNNSNIEEDLTNEFLSNLKFYY